MGWCDSVSTIVVRFGSGLPMDSKVLRPITMTWPVVICLNHLKSSGRCHGILLPAPITRSSDMAAMALKGCTATKLSDKAGAVNAAWIGASVVGWRKTGRKFRLTKEGGYRV